MRSALLPLLLFAGCVDAIDLGTSPDGSVRRDAGADGGASGDGGASAWEPLTVTGAEDVSWYDIHGDSTGRIWVVGDQSTVARLDGDQWTVYRAGSFDKLNAVFAVSPSEVYVAGNAGLLFRFDGTDWTTLGSEVAPLLDDPVSRADFTSIWGEPGGDVFIATDAWFRVNGGIDHAVLRYYHRADDAYEWTYALLDGISSANEVRGAYAIASDDLWSFFGSRYTSLRKPFEAEYNSFLSLAVPASGLLHVLAHPSATGKDELFVLSGAGWSKINGLDPELRLFDLATDPSGQRLFATGSDGVLGEVVDGEMKIVVAPDQARPLIRSLYVDARTAWGVGDKTVLRRALDPR
jgi:hypothetical protein